MSIKNLPKKAGQLGKLNSPSSQGIKVSKNAQSAKSNTTKSNVSVSNVSIINSQVNSISGKIVSGNGTITPFSLSGTLYRDPIQGRIDGSLKDQLHNFKVVRFQIIENPSKAIFYNEKAKKFHGTYIALYLEKDGTRNITLLEKPAVSVLGGNTLHKIENEVSSFSKAPKKDTFWIEKLFQPDKVTHTTSSKSKHPSKQNNQITIQPMSVTTNSKYIDWTTNYYIFGYTVQDTIELNYKVTYPSTTASSSITGRLGVDYTDYSESNGTDLNQTAWEVGGNGKAGVKLTCPNGSSQRIQWESIAGRIEQSGSWTVNWSYSLAWEGAGLTLNYYNGGRYSLGSGANKDPNGAYIATAYINSSNQYLNSVGDYISANWTAPQYSNHGGAQYVTDRVDFIYDMYNAFEGGNGTDYGTTRNYLSFTTYAN